jgi:hypothetical protein
MKYIKNENWQKIEIILDALGRINIVDHELLLAINGAVCSFDNSGFGLSDINGNCECNFSCNSYCPRTNTDCRNIQCH